MRIEFIEDNTGELAQEEVNKWRTGADNMARLYEDAKRRIAELEAQNADLRDLAYSRAPKIAAEEANRQQEELKAQLAETREYAGRWTTTALKYYPMNGWAFDPTIPEAVIGNIVDYHQQKCDEVKVQLAEAMRQAASERQHAANAEAKLAEAKDDIEELTICEDCGEEDAKLEVNNCWPPRYCHGCRHKLVTEICELRKRAEIAEAKEGGTA